MIYSTKQELTLSVPLSLSAHQKAQQFYQQHRYPQKAKQVYLNTLAVEAVRIYLGWLGIKSDSHASDSSDPIIQALADVADLDLPDQRKLECRPVLPAATTCYIPPETITGRLGYLPVQFDSALKTATLLGFIPSEDIDLTTQEVPLSSIQSLDILLKHIEPAAGPSAKSTHLGKWLEGAIASDWQTIEALFERQPAFSFRSLNLPEPAPSSAVRGKLLELSPSVDRARQSQQSILSTDKELPIDISALNQYANCRVALVVAITPSDVLQSNVWVKLCPIDSRDRLPDRLEIRIRDDRDVVVIEAQSHQTDMLQLNFRGRLNEQFSVEVALKEILLVEEFVI